MHTRPSLLAIPNGRPLGISAAFDLLREIAARARGDDAGRSNHQPASKQSAATKNVMP
jgi:hypothetical protein